MLKRGLIVFGLVLVLTMSFASAGLGDWIDNLFGGGGVGTSPCNTHARAACVGDRDIYWFDSCGNQEEAIYPNGCAGQFPDRPYCRNFGVNTIYGQCDQCATDSHCSSGESCDAGVCSGLSNCVSRSYSACSPSVSDSLDIDVYWFDSCRQKQEKKKECGDNFCSATDCPEISNCGARSGYLFEDEGYPACWYYVGGANDGITLTDTSDAGCPEAICTCDDGGWSCTTGAIKASTPTNTTPTVPAGVDDPTCIPSSEICDYKDNDCDGLIDEGSTCDARNITDAEGLFYFVSFRPAGYPEFSVVMKDYETGEIINLPNGGKSRIGDFEQTIISGPGPSGYALGPISMSLILDGREERKVRVYYKQARSASLSGNQDAWLDYRFPGEIEDRSSVKTYRLSSGAYVDVIEDSMVYSSDGCSPAGLSQCSKDYKFDDNIVTCKIRTLGSGFSESYWEDGEVCGDDEICVIDRCVASDSVVEIDDGVFVEGEIDTSTYIRAGDYVSIDRCEPFLGDVDGPLKILLVNLDNVPHYDKLVDDIVYNQLKAVSPFKENFDSIAFYTTSIKSGDVDLECGGFGNGLSGSGFACNNEKVYDKIKEKCDMGDKRGIIVIVIGESKFGGAGGDVIYLGSSSDRDLITQISLSKNVALHEIGHNFGLADLYYGSFYGDGRPSKFWSTEFSRAYLNVDGPGCNKWCDSFKPASEYSESFSSQCLGFITKESCVSFSRDDDGRCDYTDEGPSCCVWSDEKFEYFDTSCVPAIGSENIGESCFEDSGCYFGAVYGNYAWRPILEGSQSIMYHTSSSEFDAVSKRELENIFECCLSSESGDNKCESFRKSYSDFLQNYGFKKRIGSCGYEVASITITNSFAKKNVEEERTIVEKQVKDKAYEAFCFTNKDCSSGICLNGECTRPNIWQGITSWFKELFG